MYVHKRINTITTSGNLVHGVYFVYNTSGERVVILNNDDTISAFTECSLFEIMVVARFVVVSYERM